MKEQKLNKYARSVSIIGVGCTPFMYTVDKEETNGLTEGELFGYAALGGAGHVLGYGVTKRNLPS